MSLTDLMKRDAAKVLLTDFAETVRYRTAAGAISTIQAVVAREALSQQREDRGRSLAGPIQVSVNKADVPVVVTDGDAMELKRRVDDPAGTWQPVSAILSQDEAMWLLAVGR